MQLTSYDMECLTEAKNIIEKDTSVHYPIDAIARKVGIGKTKLKAGFKFVYGITLYAYLIEQRMQQAMHLLKETTKPIKQISKAVGFKHPNNFITAFKLRFGCTPGQIKK